MSMYVGLDVHKRACYATVMNERGEVVKQEKFPNEREEFKRFFNCIGDAKVAMEACYCWQPAYELLDEMGYDVELAHPMKTRIIAEAKIKTDASDSEALAHLLRTNLLPTSYVPPRETRELRELVRLRTYLVRERTRFKNKVHAELVKRGIKAMGNPFTKRGMARLRELGIGAVDTYVVMMESLDGQINELSKTLKQTAGKNEDAKLLMTAPGVGYFSALLVLAEIGDISRFSDAEKLCSYAGLVPSTRQSGSSVRRGSITKQGSGLLRWALIQCAWAHVRNDGPLAGSFRGIAKRKGVKVAVVATARKMLVAIYWMLKRREVFRV